MISQQVSVGAGLGRKILICGISCQTERHLTEQQSHFLLAGILWEGLGQGASTKNKTRISTHFGVSAHRRARVRMNKSVHSKTGP